MHLDVMTEYRLVLTANEFSLVGRALAGRLSPEDAEKAKELSAKITEMRLKQAEAVYQRCKQVADSFEEKA